MQIFKRLIKYGNCRRFSTTITNPGGEFTTAINAYKSVEFGVLPLNNVGLLKVYGKDSIKFLQGMTTNDISFIERKNPSYNGILNPNGRYLFDCIISMTNNEDEYIIESNMDNKSALLSYLKKYKLRSKVKFEDLSDSYRVWSVLCNHKRVNELNKWINNSNNNTSYIDPRYNKLGIRMIIENDKLPNVPDNCAPLGYDFYETLRILYGIPTNNIELIPDKSIILEANFPFINGINFNKGCYVGQVLSIYFNILRY